MAVGSAVTALAKAPAHDTIHNPLIVTDPKERS
jgi:hypothetical protein